MKYVDKNFVSNQDRTKIADIVAKPWFSKKLRDICVASSLSKGASNGYHQI